MTFGSHARTARRARALHNVGRVVELDVERHGATVRVEIDGLPPGAVSSVVSLLLAQPVRAAGRRAIVSPAPGVTLTLNPGVRS